MEYPNQKHQTIVTKMYHVHGYHGFESFETLKAAREYYKEEKLTYGIAMITKTTTKDITLITNEHVQGYL